MVTGDGQAAAQPDAEDHFPLGDVDDHLVGRRFAREPTAVAHCAAVNRAGDVLIAGERGRQDLNRIPVAHVV